MTQLHTMQQTIAQSDVLLWIASNKRDRRYARRAKQIHPILHLPFSLFSLRSKLAKVTSPPSSGGIEPECTTGGKTVKRFGLIIA